MGEIEERKVKKIKQFLRIWGNYEEICKEKEERIEELKRLCLESREIKATKISEVPKIGFKTYQDSITENLAIKNIEIYEKAIKRLEREIRDVIDVVALINYWISFLKPEEIKLIKLRYREGFSWDYIPEIIHRSRMQCFRIHNNIIKSFDFEDFSKISG